MTRLQCTLESRRNRIQENMHFSQIPYMYAYKNPHTKQNMAEPKQQHQMLRIILQLNVQ